MTFPTKLSWLVFIENDRKSRIQKYTEIVLCVHEDSNDLCKDSSAEKESSSQNRDAYKKTMKWDKIFIKHI